jgi:DNA-binding transcriptional regulator YiaG
MNGVERTRVLAKSRAIRELPPPHVCRRIRDRAGLSDRDVAAVLGVSHTAVWYWETGQRRPAGANLEGYVKFLNLLQQERAR